MLTKMNLDEFCQKLPKIELHAHLNGSLSKKTLIKLGCLDKNIAHYQKLTKLLNTTEKTLNECFELFQIAQNATNNTESLYLATKSVIDEFHEDNVIYVEIRTTPRSGPEMTKADYIETVVKAIEDNPNDIIVKLLLSVDRSKELDQETINVILDKFKKYPEIIKGVDFSGNPHTGHFPANSFNTFRENGLKTTIHCAEIKNDEEVAEILKFRPDRLGHVTCLHPNYNGCDANWALYKQLRIPVECCLTSNITCGTSPNYRKHHLKEWIKNSLPFCINTDDKGVFCTTLSRELLLVAQHFHLNQMDLLEICCNAIEYSFASYEEKVELKRKSNLLTKNFIL